MRPHPLEHGEAHAVRAMRPRVYSIDEHRARHHGRQIDQLQLHPGARGRRREEMALTHSREQTVVLRLDPPCPRDRRLAASAVGDEAGEQDERLRERSAQPPQDRAHVGGDGRDRLAHLHDVLRQVVCPNVERHDVRHRGLEPFKPLGNRAPLRLSPMAAKHLLRRPAPVPVVMLRLDRPVLLTHHRHPRRGVPPELAVVHTMHRAQPPHRTLLARELNMHVVAVRARLGAAVGDGVAEWEYTQLPGHGNGPQCE